MILYNFLAYILLFLLISSLFIVSVSLTFFLNLFYIDFVAMKVLILVCFVAILCQAMKHYHLANYSLLDLSSLLLI